MELKLDPAEISSVLRKHIDERPPRVTSPRGPLPEVLVACVARALAKDPDGRFRSVTEMKETLAQARRELASSEQRQPR